MFSLRYNLFRRIKNNVKRAKNVNVNLLQTVTDGSFLFLYKTFIFLFLLFLNLGPQVRCPPKSVYRPQISSRSALVYIYIRQYEISCNIYTVHISENVEIKIYNLQIRQKNAKKTLISWNLTFINDNIKSPQT